jgi:DNA-binding transcriptional LysR family regulator
MTELNVWQCRCLAAVAEHGSFTAAAAELGCPQPTVSRAVAALERALGLRLVDRTTHDCALTPAGAQMLPRVLAFLDAAEAVTQLARRVAAPGACLRVAVKPDSDAGLLPDALQAWEARPAAPAVHVVFLDTHQLADAVRAGRADLALITGPHDASGLDWEMVWREERLAILSGQHPLAPAPHPALAALHRHPVITWPGVPRQVDRYYRGADRLPDADGAPDGPPATTLAEALRLVELNRGITFLPWSVADRYQRPEIVARPVAALSDSTAILAWPEDSRDRHIAAFVRLTCEIAQQRAAAAVAPLSSPRTR